MKNTSTAVLGIGTVLTGLLVSFQPGAFAADILGKVTLNGTPPTWVSSGGVIVQDYCSKIGAQERAALHHYIVSSNGGLANVFVYVKKDGLKAPPTSEPPILDQVECQFQPYVIGVVAGQKLRIRNSDPVMHNIHATPKINKEFNFSQTTAGEIDERSFDQPEVLVRIRSDIHGWMFAYVGVCNHPYFAVTRADGSFRISGVPDGRYTLVAYHVKTHWNRNDGMAKEIDIKGDNIRQDFEIISAMGAGSF